MIGTRTTSSQNTREVSSPTICVAIFDSQLMSPPTQVIRHIHLPSITPFYLASRLQSHLVAEHLSYKALASSSPATFPSPSLPPAPPHTLLTFTPTPSYTTGRRELHIPLSGAQIASLSAPLPLWEKNALVPPSDAFGQPLDLSSAEIVPTLRGGLITFHGPGQLVIYAILDLARLSLSPSTPLSSTTPSRFQGLSARCFIHLLEHTTISVLARFGIRGLRTQNPGVWVDEDRKIAAVGTHLRRRITSFGMGLNVSTDLRWFERIVACGLEGKRVVGIREALNDRELSSEEKGTLGQMMELEAVGRLWSEQFARSVVGENGRVRMQSMGQERAMEMLRSLKEEDEEGERLD